MSCVRFCILCLFILLISFELGHAQQSIQDPTRFHPAIPQHSFSLPVKAHPKKNTDSPGTKRVFFVRNVLDQSKWNKISFVLISQESQVNYWVDTVSVYKKTNPNQLDSILTVFNQRMTKTTPSGSLDSTLGIVPLEAKYISPLPNSDGDGFLDVLIFDIQDGFESSGQYVAGFFDPVDQLDYPFSNKRDILYLDIWPTIIQPDTISIEQGAQTLAHELQHLIHSQFYLLDNPEWISINEGCSELVEYLCGFNPRKISSFQHQTDKSWYIWNDNEAILSYERSSVFISWVYFRYGLATLVNLIQAESTGINGLLDATQETAFSTLMLNWVQDLVMRVRQGSDSPFPKDWRPELVLSPLEVNRFYPVQNSISLEPGGFQFIRLEMANHYQIASQSDSPLTFIPVTDRFIQFSKNAVLGTDLNFKIESASDSSVLLIFINTNEPRNEEDHRQTSGNFLIEGSPKNQIRVLQTDDGQPDEFFGSAKFLRIPDSIQSFATWIPDSTGLNGGIREFSALIGYLSEFEGTGVPSGLPRRFILSFADSNQNLIGNSLLFDSSRPYAQIGFETHQIPESHPVYRQKRGGIWVVISPDRSLKNGLALGMDYNGLDAFKVINSGGNWSNPENIWPSEYNLEGFQPMVRLGVSRPLNFISKPISIQCGMTRDSLFFSFPDGGTRVGKLTLFGETTEKVFSFQTKDNKPLAVFFPFYGDALGRFDFISSESIHSFPIRILRFPVLNERKLVPWSAKRNQSVSISSSGSPLDSLWGIFSYESGDTTFLNPIKKDHQVPGVSLSVTGGVSFYGSGVYKNSKDSWFWDLQHTIYFISGDEGNSEFQPGFLSVSNAFPNPMNPSTKFQLQSDRDTEFKLEVFNVLGQLLKSDYLLAKTGRQWIEVNLIGATTGTYWVRFSSKGKVSTRKFVLLK
ncbi:MAG: T9SS type A sorting domain-containing protein [Bacteroidetes bacterium]|nr:T9SS type A sorting domain-containing protein [Bacteroidota bacterium]MCA0446132.1 T9SS type A sorting domain-containing protein [Bacteroidota bacterium]